MKNVVFAKWNRIAASSKTAGVVDSLSLDGKEIVVLDVDKLSLSGLEKYDVYVPATVIDTIQGNNVKAYHELLQYPFFQRTKETILEEGTPKGVFRLRRMVDSVKNNAVILSDLCVLASMFGETEKVVIRHSRLGVVPAHVIVLIRYVCGTMAQIDYTFSDKEFVELEWSGIRKIIEFHSEEVNPVKPSLYHPITLQYDIKSILESSKRLDLVWEEFQRYRSLVGGDES
ncbi:hypothetical protein [Ornithinibacillus bavariensis]|uniref:Uncharacterized protein n=1 Tax=Ornithinibacillus bavariensis TaxID=545502 RepID=A0A919X748_9BACI|nr:hypothetical protein [Ornithinibacillus bavariensis]GIO26989.1 hypothetical protein J43TS3_16000 [Ornithinibacillus bavariensis]